MGFSTTALLGPIGGQLALAFGTGCAAGYAFCLRTVHKMLNAHKDHEHEICLQRIERLEEEKEELKTRLAVIEDRLYLGSNRQAAQIRESAVRILGGDKLGEDQ